MQLPSGCSVAEQLRTRGALPAGGEAGGGVPGDRGPENIATLLRDPPRYGQGLLPWIKLMAIRMLGTGADPQIIARALHLATRDQEFSSAELRALKSAP
jgi:hypothetical protein